MVGFGLANGFAAALGIWNGSSDEMGVFVAVSLALIAVGLWFHDRVAYVELFEDGVWVTAAGRVAHYGWDEITSVAQAEGFSTPTYRVRFSEERAPVYCFVQKAYASAEVMGRHFSKDLSGFGETAHQLMMQESVRRRKAELEAEAGPRRPGAEPRRLR